MDPASALSAAAAVFQFIDFGAKLISKTWQIHNHGKGLPVEHRLVRDASLTLKQQCKILQTHASTSKHSPKIPLGRQTLNHVVSRSVKLAEELSSVFEELYRAGGARVFKSFRQALKSVWNKERVENMRCVLNDVRAELTLSMLIVIR